MINILGWIIIGFLAGLVAKVIYPGAEHMGFIMTTLLGIAGSFVGGFIGGLFSGNRGITQPSPAGFVMSVVGAMVLIFIAHRLGLR